MEFAQVNVGVSVLTSPKYGGATRVMVLLPAGGVLKLLTAHALQSAAVGFVSTVLVRTRQR